MQEADAGAASVDALAALCAENPLMLPLGFAYGAHDSSSNEFIPPLDHIAGLHQHASGRGLVTVAAVAAAGTQGDLPEFTLRSQTVHAAWPRRRPASALWAHDWFWPSFNMHGTIVNPVPFSRCCPRSAGHLPGLALSGLRHVGRGFAAQQLIEEWNARRALSVKVCIVNR